MSKKSTINDVARAAGVSKKTVSRVINRADGIKDETRRKIERIIAELGYIPNPQARALALRRNFLIGLVFDNPNAQTILNFQQGVLDALHDTEFALVVRPVDRQSPHLLRDLRRFLEEQRPFGVILLPPISEREEIIALCSELGCDYVRLGPLESDEFAHKVESNDSDAISRAVDYLVGHGHRRIGLIAGPDGFRSSKIRREAFLAAMERHGLDCPEDYLTKGKYTFDSGKEAAIRLLGKKDRPTAIFASNDEMAAGALHMARELGLKVPDDLSLIGFDDSPTSLHVYPPLTTIRWPMRAMACDAASRLIKKQTEEPQGEKFQSQLILRSSVGRVCE